MSVAENERFSPFFQSQVLCALSCSFEFINCLITQLVIEIKAKKERKLRYNEFQHTCANLTALPFERYRRNL